MQEQQLRARQLVLQQQAASAIAAASKTQREVGAPACHALNPEPTITMLVFWNRDLNFTTCMFREGARHTAISFYVCYASSVAHRSL
jgi:hypothetical protein